MTDDTNPFTDRFARLLPVGLGVLSAALYLRERRARQAAERMAGAALESLLNAIDANDPETGHHVRRVASFALVLADALGLDERQRRAVERVAIFHDIGKIHEALFDIVHDDAHLSAADRRAIATHPRRGAEVLSPLVGFYPELPQAVLSHHERWDGKGYPRHLRGTRIPLEARIVSVADTFDAVTHTRRYRSGRGARAAAEIIRKGRGTQFDPRIVDCFLQPEVLDRVLQAQREAYRESHPPAHEERRSGDVERAVPEVSFRWRAASRVSGS